MTDHMYYVYISLAPIHFYTLYDPDDLVKQKSCEILPSSRV